MTNAVDLISLSKSFKTGKSVVRAVQDLSLSIPRGQAVALLGPNGAGKSTAIDMLLGLSRPDSGEVRINGGTPQSAIRQGKIGAMLQNGGLIGDLTVRELVTMIASLYPNSMEPGKALTLARMEGRANQRASKLSGGEAQRVRFAIAVVSSPTLLVLDEPTAAMDVKGREDFWSTISQLELGGVTALFATHHLDEVDLYADRVVVINSGKLIAEGTPREIKAMAGGRQISAICRRERVDRYGDIPGASTVAWVENRILVKCTDSDVALRALLQADPNIRDIEVATMGLQEAFMQLTAGDLTSESKEVARQ